MFAGLGVKLEITPGLLRTAIESLGFAFFFAPAWHPGFKAVALARRRLATRGQRTIFNLIAPLINPGRPAYTLLGVATPALVDKMGEAFAFACKRESGLSLPPWAVKDVLDALHTPLEKIPEPPSSIRIPTPMPQPAP